MHRGPTSQELLERARLSLPLSATSSSSGHMPLQSSVPSLLVRSIRVSFLAPTSRLTGPRSIPRQVQGHSVRMQRLHRRPCHPRHHRHTLCYHARSGPWWTHRSHGHDWPGHGRHQGQRNAHVRRAIPELSSSPKDTQVGRAGHRRPRPDGAAAVHVVLLGRQYRRLVASDHRQRREASLFLACIPDTIDVWQFPSAVYSDHAGIANRLSVLS